MGLFHHSTTPLSPPKPWSFLFSAKSKSFSADLHFASPPPPRPRPRRRLFSSPSFFSLKRSPTHSPFTVSLRIRLRQFLLKVKIAAGRLKELRLSSLGRFRKVTLIDVKASDRNCAGNQLISFSPFASSSPQGWPCSTSPWRQSPSLSQITKIKLKKNTFVCGAGLGTLIFVLSRCATVLHLPLVLVQTGFSIARVIARNLRFGKSKNADSSGASPMIRGLRFVATACRMAFIIFQRTFLVKRLVVSAILLVTVGLILMRKSSKLQKLLARKEYSRTGMPRVLLRMLIAIKLIKRWWAHVDTKTAIVLMVLVAMLSNLMKQQQQHL